MKTAIEIGTTKANQGEKSTGYLHIGELAGGVVIKIPVIIINGIKDGPTLWINAAVHGDELPGIEIARKVFNNIKPIDLSGAIVLVPISNIPAYFSKTHSNPIELSQPYDQYFSFPGDRNGKLTERTAYAIFNEIKLKANYLISYHSLNRYCINEPYTNFTVVPNAEKKVQLMSENMAKLYATSIICKLPPEKRSNTLDFNCISCGIPAIMVELKGGGKILDRDIKSGWKGLLNILKYLKMIDGEPKPRERQFLITQRGEINANRAGLIFVEVQPGNVVSKGGVIARIYNELFKEVETIKAEVNTLVFGTREYPVVNTGDRVVSGGFKWEEINP